MNFMEAPNFISRDPEQIIKELIQDYEARTGKVLQPAQVERLIFQSWAYRETLIRNAIQDAALQNLVDFARAPVLDFLGRLVGVNRLPAGNASVSIVFTIVAGSPTVIIPLGTRVASADGNVVFATKVERVVQPSTPTVTVEAESITPGASGNGFLAGQIATVLDPLPFIVSAINSNTSAGGADQESDDALRERIRLAPASFSNAGSSGAYLFWTKTANANIIDVAVTNPIPGTVEVFPLMNDGEPTPTQVLTDVLQTLSAEKVRPLTDTVLVTSPTKIDYDIDVELVILDTAVALDIETAVNAALEAFVLEKRLKLGQDITESQVIARCMVPGVYTATLVSWTDIVCDVSEFGVCGTITVTTTGTNPG
jgi:phage-related baseplate assembly protein